MMGDDVREAKVSVVTPDEKIPWETISLRKRNGRLDNNLKVDLEVN